VKSFAPGGDTAGSRSVTLALAVSAALANAAAIAATAAARLKPRRADPVQT